MLTRNICVAFVAALLFHFIVLVQKFVVHNEPKLDKEVISVVISYDERVKPQPQTKSEPQNIEAKQDIVPPPPLATVITTTDNQSDKREAQVKVNLSQSSAVFKRWLESETDNFTDKNSEAVSEFSQTFYQPKSYKSPEALSPNNGVQIPVRSIEYVTEVNGKRTCYVRVANLLDAGGSDNWLGTACTPQKKFDVKLNQPNNGWADR